MTKIAYICNYPARSKEYACDSCGGDIRDIRCCDRKFCERVEYEDKENP